VTDYTIEPSCQSDNLISNKHTSNFVTDFPTTCEVDRCRPRLLWHLPSCTATVSQWTVNSLRLTTVSDVRNTNNCIKDNTTKPQLGSPKPRTFGETRLSLLLRICCFVAQNFAEIRQSIGCWETANISVVHLLDLKNTYLVTWLSSSSKSAVVYQILSKLDDFYHASVCWRAI